MSSSQDALTKLKKTLPQPIQDALAFEQRQWTNGSVLTDPFYDVTGLDAEAAPGSFLKVEELCDPSQYMTPPMTAISRFIYQSRSLNGSLVPVSALILWPYAPRRSADGYQVVAWSHSTSGTTPECAPSHIKNLWQHYLAPFNLTLNGYVVVQTDYAGLGVARDMKGKRIVHEYLASPSHANDVLYAVRAAQAAFPRLSRKFVVAGHSQGGGSAWACARKHAVEPVEGYLGAVAVSPVTDVRKEPAPIRSLVVAAMMRGVKNMYPEFKEDDVLTREALQRQNFVEQLDCTTRVSIPLIMGLKVLRPGWEDNTYIKSYFETVSNGAKPIDGPMLVVHGDRDANLAIDVASTAVDQTARVSPKASIDYVAIPGPSHVPTLSAGQRVWMDWIADRFAGVPAEPGYNRSTLETALPLEGYQEKQTWYLEQATQFYHTS